MRILFLYTEVAGYTISCIKEYLKLNSNNELYLIRYPVNNEAPFKIDSFERLYSFIKPENITELHKIVNEVNPNHIICSGWSDKEYLNICKLYRKKITITLMFDNYWEGTFRQIIAVLIGKYWLKKYFHNCWVPGPPQVEYAKKLGFKPNEIFQNFYSADISLFQAKGGKAIEIKKENFPKVFLYVGRYLELKGITDLWEAFIKFQKDNPNEWELWCIGTGDLFEKKIVHPKIKHFGFIHPEQLNEFIDKAGVFIMPSHYDHWGVAVQEFASAGFPIICSDKVGSASIFLIENENGYSFKAKDVNSLKMCLNKIVCLSQEELYAMGKISSELAKQITPEIWSNELKKILK